MSYLTCRQNGNLKSLLVIRVWQPYHQHFLEFALRRQFFDRKNLLQLGRSYSSSWIASNIATINLSPRGILRYTWVEQARSGIASIRTLRRRSLEQHWCIWPIDRVCPELRRQIFRLWGYNSMDKSRQRQAFRIILMIQFLTIHHEDGPGRYLEAFPDNHLWVNLSLFLLLVTFFPHYHFL